MSIWNVTPCDRLLGLTVVTLTVNGENLSDTSAQIARMFDSSVALNVVASPSSSYAGIVPGTYGLPVAGLVAGQLLTVSPVKSRYRLTDADGRLDSCGSDDKGYVSVGATAGLMSG